MFIQTNDVVFMYGCCCLFIYLKLCVESVNTIQIPRKVANYVLNGWKNNNECEIDKKRESGMSERMTKFQFGWKNIDAIFFLSLHVTCVSVLLLLRPDISKTNFWGHHKNCA